MAQSKSNPGSSAPQDSWRQGWEERRDDIDRGIVSSLGQGRSVDDAFAEVSKTARTYVNAEDVEEADYNSRFRDYYESRLADLEKGGALARQENGSFYVNPEYVSGEGPGNRGTMENKLAEGATSSRSSAGSADPGR